MKKRKGAAVLLAGFLAGTTLLGGCNFDSDTVVLTVDETEVTLGFANFVVKYNQAEVDDLYTYYMGEDIWSQSTGSFMETYGDSMKDSAIEDIQTWVLLDNAKEDYDVSVSDDELEEITEAAEEFMEANEDDAIEQVGATQEYVEQMLYYYVLAAEMQTAIGEEAEITVTEEDAAMRTFSYIYFSIPEDEEEEEEEEEEEDEDSDDEEEEEEESLTLEEIEAYAESAQEDFDTVYDEISDAGTGTVGSYSYASDEDTLSDELIEAADALSEGEVSGLVETDSYYYILRLDSEYDEEASEEYLEELIQEEKDTYYEEVLEELEENASIKLNRLQWSKVVLKDIFTVVSDDDEE